MTINDNSMTIYDVVIIGSGPAGLTAGIYAARANLSTLILAGEKWGGQLMETTLVENFPGFPEGIIGPDLMMNMRKQAEKMGAEIREENAEEVDLKGKPFGINGHSAHAVIIATGAEYKKLGVPGEEKLTGRGVSYCATCDAAFFKNKKVAVVGGGDAAMEVALFLTKFASEVIIIHRRESFRASKVMQERVLTNPKIKVMWNTVVEEIVGEEKVTGIKMAVTDSHSIVTDSHLLCDGIFVAVGHEPATNIFKNLIEFDEKNFIKRNNQYSKSDVQYKTMTNIPGVFTAGDVHDIDYKQAITAAGYGCEAALDAERWLDNQSK